MDSIEVVMPRHLRHGYIFTWYHQKSAKLSRVAENGKVGEESLYSTSACLQKKKRVNDIFIIAITTAIF